MVDLGLEHDIIQKSGSWYSYGDERIGQGRDVTKEWLKTNDDRREAVKQAIKVALGMVPDPDAPEADEDEVPANGQEALLDA